MDNWSDEEAPPRSGRIVTFYSFKGGVGRTMALANVAFMAAAKGRRVLVMDWDLEAPGLAYYFRGMQEGAGARAVRTAPGILDIVWGWSTGLAGATSHKAVEELVEDYRSGGPFARTVRSLIPDFDDVLTDDVEPIGRLDIIGAGGQFVNTPGRVSYEEALARFDWRSFFEQEAGGTLLTSLREWCKSRYDYVLIDSRTGFADVAGICTMQLPDVVALCFVYNRQNIDGVAQIAGAIRSHRGSEIAIRAAPMRTARENTTEEASARARARKELIRRGQFTAEEVDRDLQELSVQSASNIPFFETIATIASGRRADPLALDYVNLATALLGEEIPLPNLSEPWADAVRRRLQPRQATTDYVLKLKSTDPERAYLETLQLLEGALEDHMDGEVDEDYAQALIDMAAQLVRGGLDAFEAARILEIALDLARSLADTNPLVWKARLADVVETNLEAGAAILDEEEELLLLDEADQLLSELPGERNVLRRLANRRRAARVQLSLDNHEAATQLVREFLQIADTLESASDKQERNLETLAAHIDAFILKGDIEVAKKQFKKALNAFKDGIAASAGLSPDSRPDLIRLRYDALSRVARLPADNVAPREAGACAIEALDWAGNSNVAVFQFVELGEAVVRTGDDGMVRAFLSKAFMAKDRRISQFPSYYGRSERTAARLVKLAIRLLQLLTEPGPETAACKSDLMDVVVAVLRQFVRRSPSSLHNGNGSLGTALAELMSVLDPVADAQLRAEVTEWSNHYAGASRPPRFGRRERPA